MRIIGNVVVTDEVLGEYFACDVSACRGGCCLRGGDGPPLTPEEADMLAGSAIAVKPFKDATGVLTIPLIAGGRCACAVETGGVMSCGIQKAYEQGKFPWPKPVSCHLYPLRIVEKPPFFVVTYDVWDICASARESGRRAGIRLTDFCAEALKRRFDLTFPE